MAKTLQDLRKEAGYKSAREFAERNNIPVSTYTRYERAPESIPLRAAWEFADKLDCSIDMVVGRVPIDVKSMRGNVQKLYDDLTDESKRLFDEFLDFVKMKERSAESRRRFLEMQKYEEMARDYNAAMYKEAGADSELFNRVVFGRPDRERAAFVEYVAKRMAKDRKREIDKEYSMLKEIIIPPKSIQEEYGEADNERLRSKRYRQLERELERISKEKEARDKEVMEKVVEAYDRMRRRRNASVHGTTEYYFTDIP